jgi:endoglucanase
MYHTKVTYTYNGKDSSPYVTKSGNGLTAGNQNAIVRITANSPEADNYLELHQSITVIVGDSSQAVNKDEYYASEPVVVPPDTGVGIIKTKMTLPLHATIAKSMLSVGSRDAGDINVDVFSVTGQKVLSKTMRNNATMSLANIPTGSYLIVITQDIKQLNVKWNKAE